MQERKPYQAERKEGMVVTKTNKGDGRQNLGEQTNKLGRSQTGLERTLQLASASSLNFCSVSLTFPKSSLSPLSREPRRTNQKGKASPLSSLFFYFCLLSIFSFSSLKSPTLNRISSWLFIANIGASPGCMGRGATVGVVCWKS